MDVSILVCSHNRASSLARLLVSLSELDIPSGTDWEVVLVLNACTDNSGSVASRFADGLPLRIVEEPRPGISNARNASIRAARGELLFCTDDDVTVPEDWFTRMLDGFTRYSDAAFLGGDIVPVFPGADPAWARAACKAAGSAFATFRVGKRDVRLTRTSSDRRLPFGANMAFRRAAFSAVSYDSALGRQPGPIFLGGEESDVFRRLLDNGRVGYLLASNPVKHWIEADRQTEAYIQKFYFGQGVQRNCGELANSAFQRWLQQQHVNFLYALFSILAKACPTRLLLLQLWLTRQVSHFAGRQLMHKRRGSWLLTDEK
jgi:glycosyltransferase involved in cell wall biosynthesis